MGAFNNLFFLKVSNKQKFALQVSVPASHHKFLYNPLILHNINGYFFVSYTVDTLTVRDGRTNFITGYQKMRLAPSFLFSVHPETPVLQWRVSLAGRQLCDYRLSVIDDSGS